MLRKTLVGLCLCLAAFGVCQQKYALQGHTIRAGVVLLDSNVDPVAGTSPQESNNWAPFVWYNLDLDATEKPSGWTFDNPNHPGVFTGTLYSRWNTISTATSVSIPASGTPLIKNMAAYWEVQLSSISDAQLAKYDVLVVPAHGAINLTTVEREMLHRFMDQGGVLWIDLNQNSAFTNPGDPTNTDLVNAFPLPFKLNGSIGSYIANFDQPVMSYPNAITLTDLGNLAGTNPYGGASLSGIETIGLSDVNSATAVPYQEYQAPGLSNRLTTIFGASSQSILNSIISVGQVGDGFEVVTTNDLSTNLGAGQANTFNATVPTFDPQIHSASKFVTNMIDLASQSGQWGKGARKLGSSMADIGAPLSGQWSDAIVYTPTQSGGYGYNPPVVFKNLVVITAGNTLYVYDENPPESLSGSGSPDDGFIDFSNGSSHDLVFQSTIATGPISSATCIEAPNAPGPIGKPYQSIMQDQIWVEDSSGNLLEWNAFGHFTDTNVSNEPPDHSVSPPNSTLAAFDPVAGAGPYPPTYQDGLLFVTDMEGPTAPYTARVWIVDPANPTQPLEDSRLTPWMMGGTGSGLPENSGPSSVGYVPLGDGSGAVDRAIYFPTQPYTPGNQPAGVTSLWFGTKGESPAPSTLSLIGGKLEIPTRCFTLAGIPPFDPQSADLLGSESALFESLAPHVTVTLGGVALSPIQFETYFSSIDVSAVTGNIECQTTSAGSSFVTLHLNATPPTLPLGVRIDYTLDWGKGTPQSSTPGDIRGQLFLVDQTSNPTRRVLNNVALGPNGMMYMVLSSQNSSGTGVSGGSYYAIQDQGRDNFAVITRWDLYDQHIESLNRATAQTVPPAVENIDPLIGLIPTLGNATPTTPGLLQDLTFTSGPSLSNGIVYVTAQGDNGGTLGSPTNPLVDDTILLAFNAQPPALTVKVPNLQSNSNGQPSFSLRQADMASSPSLLALNYSVLQPSQFTYVSSSNPDSDSITAGGVIKVNSLASTSYQSLGACFSTSQPVILSQPGAPDTLIYPDSNGSHWSPLLWYTVFTGSGLPPGPSTPTINSTNTALGPPFVSGQTIYVPTTTALAGLLSTPQIPSSPAAMVYGLSTTISPTDPDLIPDPAHPWQNQLVELTGSSLTNLAPNSDFLWPQMTGVTTETDLITRLSQATLGNPTIGTPTPPTVAYGVVGGNGRLFSWSDMGLFAFEYANIYVADSNRVASFDPDGNPLWSTDQSLSTGPTGQIGHPARLVNPSRAYSMGDNQTIVVDPGGNRLAVLDTDGVEIRSIDGFTVDPGLIPDGYAPGESTKFSGPRDVQTYTTVEPNSHFLNPAPQGEEYWVHYVIADSGNRRIVEVVDRYAYNTTENEPGALIASGILYSHSPASVSGAKYSYTCVAKTNVPSLPDVGTFYLGVHDVGNGSCSPVVCTNTAELGIYNFTFVSSSSATGTDPNGNPIGSVTVGSPYLSSSLSFTVSSGSTAFTTGDTFQIRVLSGYVIVGGIGNPSIKSVFQQGSSSSGAGGVVLFVPNSAPVQIGSISLPSITGGLFQPSSSTDELAGSFVTSTSVPTTHLIGDLNSVTAKFSGGELTLMFTDSSGVYEVNPGTVTVPFVASGWTVQWMLPRSLPVGVGGPNANSLVEEPVYSVMRQSASQPTTDNPLDFIPTFAERLPSGDILVVNGYSGRFRKAALGDDGVSFTGEILEFDSTKYDPTAQNLGFNNSSAGSCIKLVLQSLTGTRSIVQPLFADRR